VKSEILLDSGFEKNAESCRGRLLQPGFMATSATMLNDVTPAASQQKKSESRSRSCSDAHWKFRLRHWFTLRKH